MPIARGALIVFEGCDRAGKSTQVKMLMEALTKLNIPVENLAFPNRTTSIGLMINGYLLKKQEHPSELVHLLFSANRWEFKDKILKILHSGTTIIVDRYAASGAAYTAATTGKSLAWCKEPDRGLPSPDMVIFLKVSKEFQHVRSNWGEERFENSILQQAVASNYNQLMDSRWRTFDADQDRNTIHSQILEEVLHTIKKAEDLPVAELYEPAA
ncbi:thymidylate kinase [Lasioglossum baleicum]|uniref:thymidylate kinase n=1 Tax=Lasioglossum baleicum TaxID=434251 RepID=UPI003FCD0C10